MKEMMLNNMNMLLMAPTDTVLYNTIRYIILGLIVACAIFLIIVILMQPSNSAGVSAISGETETFLGRNKSKTREGVLKTLTIIAVVALVVLSIAYFLVGVLFPSFAV